MKPLQSPFYSLFPRASQLRLFQAVNWMAWWPLCLLSIKQHVELYRYRIRSRRQLTKLSPEQLRDIGISEEQARVESRLPFWR